MKARTPINRLCGLCGRLTSIDTEAARKSLENRFVPTVVSIEKQGTCLLSCGVA